MTKLAGNSLTGVSISNKLFTLNFKDLNPDYKYTVYVYKVLVHGKHLQRISVLIVGSDTFDVSKTIASRCGNLRVNGTRQGSV